MANLAINLENPVTGTYRVSFRDSSGNLITNSLLTQNQLVTLTNASVANVTIGNGVYTIPDVTVRMEAVIDSTCLDDFETDLIVNCPTTVCTVTINNITEQCIGNSISIVVNASTTGAGVLQYAITTGVFTPTTWQTTNSFSGLEKNTAYVVHVRNIIDPSECKTTNNYTTGDCLPYCGCSGLGTFAINSITQVGATTTYNVEYNSCNLGIANWRVKTLAGTVMVSGSVNPVTSAILPLNFGVLPAATYILEVDSTVCIGQATKTFVVDTGITCPECYEFFNGNCMPIPDCGGSGGGTGTINYLLWQPDGGEDNFFKLTISPTVDGKYTVSDIGDNQGLTVYYSINGSSNPVNAKILSSTPLPVNEEIWITKYGHSPLVSNINDPNGNAWRLYWDSPMLPAKIGNFIFYIS